VSIMAFLLTAVLVPMLVNEFTDWLPWLAERLIWAAARTLPSAVRQRYTDEWLGELDATPGKLSKLVVAVRIFVRAPATAVIIRRVLSFKAITGKSVFNKTVAASALRWLQMPGVIAWRLSTGKPLDGVPRTDATWFTSGTKALDRGTAPRPPGSLIAEIRGDVRGFRTELRELRVRRARGREVERQILAG
jgi:hypothetical protein